MTKKDKYEGNDVTATYCCVEKLPSDAHMHRHNSITVHTIVVFIVYDIRVVYQVTD